MVLQVYAYRNKAIMAYSNPFYDNKDPKDMGITIARAIITNPQQMKDLKVCELVHLGSFDDESGRFESIEPVFIINCADYFKEDKQDA